MALLEDLTKGATPAGLAIGLGAALFAPILVPVVSRALRPVAKAAMRTGITLYRDTLEPIGAAIGDLVTEAQLELASQQQQSTSDAQKGGSRKGQKTQGPKRD